VTAKGEVYFADGNARRVGWVDAHGKVGTVQGVEMASPAGVALSPDQAMVVVTDAGARFSWSFQIAADGGLKNGEPFFRLEMPEEGWRSEVRGAALDAIGQVYFATRLGVQMCEATGRVAALLHAPGGRGGVRAVAFGGAGFAWMYVIREDGKVFRRKVKVTGANVGTVGALPKPPL
jgi:sugar lactone lactonase YvrE